MGQPSRVHWLSHVFTQLEAALETEGLAKNSIPTEVLQHTRNMIGSYTCPLCNAMADSWKHALIECTMAKCVWSLVDEDLVEHLIACRHDDARLWMIEIQD